MEFRISSDKKLILINKTLFKIKVAEKLSSCVGCMYHRDGIDDYSVCSDFEKDIGEKFLEYECYSYIIRKGVRIGEITQIDDIQLGLILLGSKLSEESLFLMSYLKINNINFKFKFKY